MQRIVPVVFEPLSAIRELYRRLDQCMSIDARRLHARLRHLERTSRHTAPPPDPARLEADIARVAEQIDRSIQRVALRQSVVPQISYPEDLPVAARREEILAGIREHQVTVICGATGSGKTTQLPKMLLELGRGTRGYIGHTQPRRIAARSVAARIAHELGTQVGSGGVVGYKVRFTDHTGDRSLVKLMTDGILLAETQNDRYLDAYDTIIIDEAHERSLNIDFLLGYLRQLLPRRPDLKVVITSATIDPQSFAEHFTLAGRSKPPIIEVSGRTYPVDIVYRPLEAQHPDEEDRDMEQGILHAVDELCDLDGVRPDPGDILVFLPGEREIRETAESLRKHPLKPAHKVDIIPLYARLSNDEQQRVFERVSGRRRIILATNVAETSLTVPGIRYVIDTGVARISRYSPRIKVQRLPIEPISQASANQRAGRSGRTEPGVCVRLYSQQNFEARQAFTDPEILRTNLAAVILQMKALDLGDIEDFPFIQAPDARSIRDGYDTLLEINALESGGLRNDLTPIGRQLAKLPIDPRIGRMLLAADTEHCLSEALVIAAALSTQDPRERPIDKAQEADAAHALFKEEGSDFLGFLKLWRELHKQQKQLSNSQFRKWCKSHYVSYLRFREWHDTHTQLRELITDMGYRPADRPARPDNVHRALLTGLLSSIGRKNDRPRQEVLAGEGDYDGARGLKFNIFPGSTLFKRDGATPKWVMAAEIVKTTRTYARTVASIQPQWIEPIAAHLVKRTYQDPHWNADLAQACAYETVTLYGLEIVKRRRIDFSKIDPNVSRTLLIHHALVNGEYLTNAKFFEHNHELARKIKDLQERSRTSELLADQQTRYAFYDKRLPPDVSSIKEFEAWRRKAEHREPNVLVMEKKDVLAPGVVEPPLEQFPDTLRVGDRDLLLEYKNDPGHPSDGVTITVPADLLPHVSAQRLEWLVPGLVREKVETLMRELPKGVRVSFVPVPQNAEQAAKKMAFGKGDFVESLTGVLREMTGVFVAREQWLIDRLPKHLRMNIRVMDARGQVLAHGRDLGQIRRELRGQDESHVLRLPDGPWNRSGLSVWDFGEMPETIEYPYDGRVLVLHPALSDEGGAEDVALRLFAAKDKAHASHVLGVRKLFFLQVKRECTSLVETTPGIEKVKLLAIVLEKTVPGASTGGFTQQISELIAYRAWSVQDAKDPAPPPPLEGEFIRTKERFEKKLNYRWTRIGDCGREVLGLAETIVREVATLEPLLRQPPAAYGAAMADIRVQLAYLLAPRFWTLTPFVHLREYPRYLGAIRRRIEKLGQSELHNGGVARDTRLLNELTPWWNRLRIRVEQGGTAVRSDLELIAYRWMVEEYRIALWGDASGKQETTVPVSPKRLEQQWGRVRQE